ncbi:MAG: pur operon repressor [Sulfobacillus acidophilus]|uniref:Pur operon repressor n=1 Tax=Sulfobacillus acidophilus TaxID=53633 RepID=A0A2T2WH70_9FIRM|nr:MAG: pur operon repressor [Sulfobacillus acidophilus]
MSDQRHKRLIALTRLITARPGDQLNLTDLSRRLNVAKSTLSEDLFLVKEALEDARLGEINSHVGAAGGVTFWPSIDAERLREGLQVFTAELTNADRLTPDGFLYVTDLLFSPDKIDGLGMLLGQRFRHLHVDYVATVETRGIPLALATSRALRVDVVLLRRDHRLSEGSSLSINYLSGSSRHVQSMSLARRALVRGGRVLFVDDFMQAGGTARAAQDLLGDFGAQVVGVGVLVATREPRHKLVEDYSAILEWNRADDGVGSVAPSDWVKRLVHWEELS